VYRDAKVTSMNSAAALGPQRASPVNRTVLYIEDHAVTRRLVGRMLLELRPQIELHVATNARDGVRAAIDARPALILLDNRLPDATGGEVLHQLASCEATAAIPVIVVSGDSAKTGNKLLAIGASEFLPKPFDIDQLMAMIDRYIH
jgi:CheY-like chemotaxis protein